MHRYVFLYMPIKNELGEDEEVVWMKDTEEVAPYCSEYDDYDDEKEEVLKDQGLALPFTRGFYLVGQIVGAMNPDDLDVKKNEMTVKFILIIGPGTRRIGPPFQKDPRLNIRN